MRDMGRHPGEEGVSEVIAAILLIGVTVLLVAIVAAIFLSGPQPDEIPHASIVARNESGSFALAHEGGDPLRVGEYRVYIDSGSGLVNKTGEFTPPDSGVWQVGGSIRYTGTWTSSERVVVTVVSGGVETILTEVGFGGGRVFDPDPVEPGEPEEKEPIYVIIEENVFVYGTAFVFSGNNVNGPGATTIITGNLNTGDLNGGASIAVSNISIDGNVNLDGGSASLGSPDKPGEIHINGSLTLRDGQRHIYGDVYVNGDFLLKDARIHGNVYVSGNLTLGDTPWIDENARIYYTGTLTSPLDSVSGYDLDIIAKCIKQETVPGVRILDLEIPPTKPEDWYMERGYASSEDLTSNMKIFADSYSSTSWRPTATDVIIIARDGDITITGMGNSNVTGIFFAPRGRVTFHGGSLEGVVIASDGLYVTSGGSTITFKNIKEYITDPEDYPF